jgi:hypothetical protein
VLLSSRAKAVQLTGSRGSSVTMARSILTLLSSWYAEMGFDCNLDVVLADVDLGQRKSILSGPR